MMKGLGATIFMLGLLVQQPSHAGQSHNFMSYGPTGESCGTWISSTGTTREILQWWVLGFVSGADFSRSTPLAVTDSKGIERWVDKYCGEHPLAPIAKAAIDLVGELSTRPPY
jgi:hypothetical protein